MHDKLTHADLRRLMQVETENAVSLYMPANRISIDTQKDTIRLKNLLTQAQEQLQAQGMRRPTALELLKPAHDLLDDTKFWRNQSAGLAIFLAPDTKPEIYRLPVRFHVHCQISYRFFVKPLLRLFSHDGHYFVLALSQQHVRFFRGDRHELEDLQVENMPTDIEEALGEWQPNPQLQFHTSTGTASDDGRQAAMFHGHGSELQMKDEILRFFRRIDDALQPVLAEERAPLVLAGVDYLHPIYEEASDYAHILEQGYTGNTDEFSEKELHAATWELVEPVFEAQRAEDQANFSQLAGTGRTGQYVDELATAAFQGRIETAFLPTGRRVWGTFDTEAGKVVAQDEPVSVGEGKSLDRTTPDTNGDGAAAEPKGKEDLLDFIALHTYLHGGTVHVLEAEHIPGRGEAAAIYRF